MAVLLSTGMRAEERVVINDNIEATVQSGIIPISINCDDPTLGGMVRAALNAHGAFSVRNGSSIKLNIGRTALTAAVACGRGACAQVRSAMLGRCRRFCRRLWQLGGVCLVSR